MSHAAYLRELLRPLGVYDWNAPFNGGELEAQGEALDQCMERLEEIRKVGYACDEEECEIGMRCLAYPIRDYTRRIIGGISITGPSSRLNSEVLMNKAHYLQTAAEEISSKLGY